VEAVKAWLALRGDAPGALFVGFRGGKGKRLAGSGLYRTRSCRKGREPLLWRHRH
jgi:hypothetical protein